MNAGVLARLPLRVRLVAAVVLLVAFALTVISAVGATVLRGSLLGRTDSQLKVIAANNARPLPRDKPEPEPERPGDRAAVRVPSKFQVQLHDANGLVKGELAQAEKVERDPPPGPQTGPDVPTDPTWLAGHAGRPVTVPGTTGDGSWRVLVRPLDGAPGWVVAATDLGEMYGTISKLIGIDLVAGAIGLLVLVVISVAIVRVSLRPLVRIEKTAAAIGAGDLSQRVPDHPPRTELGRLGRALNGMLTQIEGAFQARARSEARMRRFVADAGHDLRTPLSVIRAWAEYASRGPRRDRAELERIIRTMGEEATRMGTLVEDLLLLARLDQRLPLERQPVDVLALAVDAVRDARLLAPDRDIRLAVDSSAAYLVLGDEVRLRQVLSNLTSNALAHTPSGTAVTVNVGPGHLGELPAVVLDVTDEGPGLSPEQAERVFERFYRADCSRTRRTGGSGLGLSIVASLVSAHGGTVTVRSTPGAGATFRATLPLADEASAAA